jgi:protein arginine kinase activator
MVCEKCKKKEGLVLFTEVRDKKKIQMCLCEECAQNQSQCIEKPSFSYSIKSVLSQFLEMISSQSEKTLQCSKCGMTYQQFQKKSRLGCEEDYVIFEEMLTKILESIHGASQHIGKTPKPSDAILEKMTRQKKMDILQKQLEEAIQEEKYEDAAILRDQIKKLQGKP